MDNLYTSAHFITVSYFRQYLFQHCPELGYISKHEVIFSPLPNKELLRFGMNSAAIEEYNHCESYGNTP
jgi:hypothetical protein